MRAKPIDKERVIELLKEGATIKAVALLLDAHENSIRQISRNADNKCARCTAPVLIGRTMCAACLSGDRSRMKERRKQRRRDGVCLDCGKPRMDGSQFCAAHRQAAIGRNARYEERLKRVGGKSPRQKRADLTYRYDERAWTAWQRDGATCQICSAQDGEALIHVHHIDQDQANNALDNLICLCFACHTGVHAILRAKNRAELIAWVTKTYGA